MIPSKNPDTHGFFLWLTEHDEVRQYIQISSLFLSNNKKELGSILASREIEHQLICDKITNFFHTNLINESPHEPIPFPISKLYLPPEVAYKLSVNHLLTVKRHKMHLTVFNKAIKMCSELMSLFSIPNLIPLQIKLDVKDEFFTDILRLPSLDHHLDVYMAKNRVESLTLINNYIDFSSQKNFLSTLVSNTMPIYNPVSHYFPLNSNQCVFNRFLFSPLNPLAETLKDFTSTFIEHPKLQFSRRINILFQKFTEKYEITDKSQIPIIFLYFMRAIYDNCVYPKPEYFFGFKDQLVKPSFFDELLQSEINVPSNIKIDDRHITNRQFIETHPLLIRASQEVIGCSFHNCPLDIIYEIHNALNFVCNCFKESGLLDFDSAFSFFFMAVIYSGSPLFISSVEFVESFVKCEQLCGEFSSAFMMMSAAKAQLVSAAQKKNMLI